MIVGIGVDMVDTRETARLLEVTGGAFLRQSFTRLEQEASLAAADRAAWLSGRFAAKEALFKAVAYLGGETPDFRRIETLSDAHGRPYLVLNDCLAGLLRGFEPVTLHVSLTGEGPFAVAFVVVEGEHNP